MSCIACSFVNNSKTKSRWHGVATIQDIRSKPPWNPNHLRVYFCPNHPIQLSICFENLQGARQWYYRALCQFSKRLNWRPIYYDQIRFHDTWVQVKVLTNILCCNIPLGILGLKYCSASICLHASHGPLTRYKILRVAFAPGMPGSFSPPPTSKETGR